MHFGAGTSPVKDAPKIHGDTNTSSPENLPPRFSLKWLLALRSRNKTGHCFYGVRRQSCRCQKFSRHKDADHRSILRFRKCFDDILHNNSCHILTGVRQLLSGKGAAVSPEADIQEAAAYVLSLHLSGTYCPPFHQIFYNIHRFFFLVFNIHR